MSLRDLHTVVTTARADCDAIQACSRVCIPDAFRSAYVNAVKNTAGFSSYSDIDWPEGASTIEFVTRTDKRIFFPSVGFAFAVKLVPLYKELMAYRSTVVAILSNHGTALDSEEDDKGNVSQAARNYIQQDASISVQEKQWLDQFLIETKDDSAQWWGKGKALKRTNDFYVSPLMKAARLNAETQSEIADVTKQLADNAQLCSCLLAGLQLGSIVVDGEDLLSAALKLFTEQRKDVWQEQGRAVNDRQRSFFHDEMTSAKILALDETALKDFFCKIDGTGASKFQSMWSGGLNGGWSAIRPNGDSNKLDEARKYIEKIRVDASVAATYWADGPSNRPSGFGPSVVTELLMKFHPDQCIKHGAVSRESLEFLKLIDIPTAYKSDYSEEEYTLVRGAATVILGKMKAMKLPRMITWDAAATPPCAKPDTAPPDYLTVNEFLWWVKENQKEISKECEVKKMKAADKDKVANPPQGNKPRVNLANAEDVVLLRLASALRTKPFAILAGHSGTGKSRMVRQLAYMTCAKGGYKALLEDAEGKPLATPGNFCMVQVKPNWHDSTDLLGYYSELKEGFKGTEFTKFLCTAYAYPEVPFFVCLDEMNLAPVEQYFAEYLSAVESRKLVDSGEKDANNNPILELVTDPLLAKEAWQNKVGAQDYSGIGCELTESQAWLDKHGLTIPRNLFVVGTVNMDESTNQFSRKVLDRAFTIEMTDADFKNFGAKNPEPKFDDYAGDAFAEALMNGEVIATKPAPDASQAEKDAFEKAIGNLESIKPVLAGTSFVVAYRFANEYLLYAKSLEEMKKVIDVSAPVAGGESAPAPAETLRAQHGNAFDDMVLMKVLPRISGESEMVMKIFAGKGKADAELKDMWPQIEDAAKTGGEGTGLAGLLGVDSSCVEKMREIVERGESGGSGTLTFWP